MERMKIINLKFLKEQWREELHILRNEPFKLSISFATGVFIGFTPTVGFQTILCFIISRIFKISFIASLVGASIPTGIPWLIPFLYYGCYKVGKFFVSVNLNFTMGDFKGIKNFIPVGIIKFGKPVIIGSFICAFLGGIVSFLIVYFVTLRIKRNEIK